MSQDREAVLCGKRQRNLGVVIIEGEISREETFAKINGYSLFQIADLAIPSHIEGRVKLYIEVAQVLDDDEENPGAES